ncbi:MAG: pentapeptide repeat-containing protein [Proteobacteria bacterium]|nr:pentapeptide repeat-containing protein [Pseudomonadota bacterium]
MNIILLSISIVLLVVYMLFLARKKDFDLLKSLPQTQTLPKSKYELALRELNEFKKLPKPKSKKALVEHNSEQFYLERRLYQIQQETEAEQKSYYLACKEREISWEDYQNYFNNLSLIEKFIVPGKIKELIVLRKLYLESEQKVEKEISKFSARIRVRHHEEHVKRQREAEIEQNTLKRRSQDDQADSKSSESENDLEHDNPNTQDDPADVEGKLPPSNPNQEKQNNSTADHASTSAMAGANTSKNNHFGQSDFDDKYPDYTGLTFIDEQFSLEELEQSVVQDANFDQSYFVSVTFKNRHQYKNCSFQGTDFSHSKWDQPEAPHRILSCNFSGAKFNYSQLRYIAFYNCNFEFADLQDAQLSMVKFVNCQFENCNVTNVDFSKTVMSADMLESIDFSTSVCSPKNAINRHVEETAENGTGTDNPMPPTSVEDS